MAKDKEAKKDKKPPPAGPPSELQRRLDAVADGSVIDFKGERFDLSRGQGIKLRDRRNLTIRNLVLVGAGLGPDEPCVWVIGGWNVTFETSAIIGSADTGGKWTREGGSKQHGIMAGGTKGLSLVRCIVGHVGADWVQLTDKPTKEPCSDFSAEDCWFVRSRRQGFSGAGIDRATVRRCRFSDAQRTMLDFESEGGGASDVEFADCDFDVFTRQPNALISIGGADREGAANEGPFTVRSSRVFGGRLTSDNRSQAELRLTDNREDLPATEFPPMPDLSEYLR